MRKRPERTFSAYIGPNIPGLIQNGRIFNASAEAVCRMAPVAEAIKKYPTVQRFVVEAKRLPADKQELSTPGTLLNIMYKNLEEEIK